MIYKVESILRIRIRKLAPDENTARVLPPPFRFLPFGWLELAATLHRTRRAPTNPRFPPAVKVLATWDFHPAQLCQRATWLSDSHLIGNVGGKVVKARLATSFYFYRGDFRIQSPGAFVQVWESDVGELGRP